MNRLCLLIWLLPLPGLAQQISLTGQVSVHNSRYETGTIQYVQAAYVHADSASPTLTDVNGHFSLVFVGLDFGRSTSLQVQKEGMEVVNARDVQDVVIGRVPPLRIALAPRGRIAQARQEFYQVNLAALTRRYDGLIAQLRGDSIASAQVIQDLESQINRSIADRFEAEQVLMEQLAATRRRLPEFAHELASVNLDFASEMYQQAYELLKAGEVEQAILVLDESKLDPAKDSIMAALDSIAKSQLALEHAAQYEQKRLDTLLASMRLKAKAYEMSGNLLEALGQYRSSLQLIAQQQGKQFLLAQTENHMADLFLLCLQYDSSYTRKAHSFGVFESICDFPSGKLDRQRIELLTFIHQTALGMENRGECQLALKWIKRTRNYQVSGKNERVFAKTMRRLNRCCKDKK